MAASTSLPNPDTAPAAAAKAGKGLLVPIALGGVLLVLAAAGCWFYFFHMRHPAQTPPAAAARAPETTHSVALDPFLVNLADPSGAGVSSSYLRVVMVLREADPVQSASAKKSKEAKPKEGKPGDDPALAEQTAELRDTALGVLSLQQPEQLLSPQGKETLKQQLLAAFNQHDADARVKEVLFTEFLVQR